MAKDMTIIVKLLVAIRESEISPVFDPACVSEHILGTTAQNRDNLAIKLKNAGYIDGLCTSEDIDGVKPHKVFWDASHPSVTLAGIEYMSENSTFKKTLNGLVKAGESIVGASMNAAFSKYI